MVKFYFIYIYIFIKIKIVVNLKLYTDIDRYRNISFYWLNWYSLRYEIDSFGPTPSHFWPSTRKS